MALLLHLKFDEAVGASTFEDSSASGNDGSETGTLTAGGAGKFGQALDFPNGNGSFVTLTSDITLTGDFTVAFWFNTDDNTDHQGITGKLGVGPGNYIEFWDADQFTTRINDDFCTFTSLATMSNSTWYHVAITRNTSDSNKLHLTLDGNSVTRKEGSAAVAGDFIIKYIGNIAFNSAAPMNGLLDDVRVYDEVLSAADILTLATSPYSNTNLLDPTLLKPGLVTSGGNLKPSLVTSSYTSGTPSAAGEIKPGLRSGDDLKAGMIDADGNLKPSLLK